MFKGITSWLGNDGEESPPSDEQRLREISLEYSESVLETATQNFSAARRLGAGNYGAVYRGTLPDGHEVAVKVIEIDEHDDGAHGFADEVRVLSKFRHPNLVTLMGWGMGKETHGKSKRFLVYECLSGGDVNQRLQLAREDVRPFMWTERLWVALDAASGLAYMHNSNPKAFHRDIKSPNILMDRSGTAKMADFGLSGIAKNKDKMNMTCEQIAGTPGYACPHYIKSGKVTEETEVYAFGMVMLELLLNSMPACLGQRGNIVYPIFQVVQPTSPGALDRALAAVDVKAGWPPQLAREIAEFALRCSDMQMSVRPKFTEVGQRLRQMCEQYCQGQRGLPSTDPRLGGPRLAASSSTAPTPASAATRPQMSSGSAPLPGAGNPTCPQMGAGAAPPTRPQLGGYACGSSGAPPTRPQMGVGGAPPTRPQMGGGYDGGAGGGAPPTRPQMGVGAAPPTRPQMGVGSAPPTRPQMGGAHGPGGPVMAPATRPQVAGGGAPTRPQLGLDHTPLSHVTEVPTNPQMGSDAMPGGRVEVPTRPQLGAPASGAAGGVMPTQPQMGLGGAGGGSSSYPGSASGCHFDDLVRQLWKTGWEMATEGQPPMKLGASGSPAELADVVLECTHTTSVDVGRLQAKEKCLALRTGESPWTVGRQHQPNMFGRLVPDEAVRSCISRSHVVFSWQKAALRMKKMSPNVVLLNGKPVPPQQETLVPNGAQIGFCGQDNLTTFIVFRVAIRDPSAPPPQQPSQPATPPPQAHWQQQAATKPQLLSRDAGPSALPAAGHSPTKWSNEGPPSPFRLVCTMAFGVDIGRVPAGMRTINVAPDKGLTLGRMHQLGYFEGLLGEEPGARYLCCVSRSHLMVSAADGAGCFEVSNNSANPVVLSGRRKLGKGESGVIRSGDHIEFIGNSADGSGAPVTYLRLDLETDAKEAPLSASNGHGYPCVPPTQPVRDLRGEPLAWSSGQCGGATEAASPSPSSPSILPSISDAHPDSRSDRPPFWLVLSGSAVRASFPEAQRRLEGKHEGLTIGRAHQQSLHTNAFDPSLRQYLSRDHFRVESGRNGCRLVALSSNPIWLRRVGSHATHEVVVGEPALHLAGGDEILLFTGADDCTFDGPGNLGTLRWTFLDS